MPQHHLIPHSHLAVVHALAPHPLTPLLRPTLLYSDHSTYIDICISISTLLISLSLNCVHTLHTLPPRLTSLLHYYTTTTYTPTTLGHISHDSYLFTKLPTLSPTLSYHTRAMDVTQRSDEELDRDWKPNGRRPQSTMARHFSVALDDLFKIDNSIADLDAAVDQKYASLSHSLPSSLASASPRPTSHLSTT